MAAKNQSAECCPPFHPESWEDKLFSWKDKSFIKDDVFTFFYMPVCFGSVMTRLMKLTQKAGVNVPEYLCLSDHTSKWNMSVYLAVDDFVTDAENVKISGDFYSRVYEGNFKDTGKWCEDFSQKAKEKGLDIRKMYMWYTTCPKCAKKYGKNYVVIVGEIEK